jgi:hypothetical protein
MLGLGLLKDSTVTTQMWKELKRNINAGVFGDVIKNPKAGENFPIFLNVAASLCGNTKTP